MLTAKNFSALLIEAGFVNFDKVKVETAPDGRKCYKVALGYYYRSGMTAEKYRQKVEDFMDAHLDVFEKYHVSGLRDDFGDHWAPFRGGATFWNQSYFWCHVYEF